MLQVYSRRNCERCARVKKQLTERGLDYLEVIIGEGISRDEVLHMFPDATQVPIVSRNGSQINMEDL